jgi:hypothetical protein
MTAMRLPGVLVAALAALPSPARAGTCPDKPVIEPAEAPKCVGARRKVRGTIVKVGRSRKGNVVFVNYCEDYKTCPFTAVIFQSAFAEFDRPESWEGAVLEIEGEIKDYKGRVEIVLEEKAQVKVVSAPAAAPARAPPGAAPTRAEPLPDGVLDYRLASRAVGGKARVRGRVANVRNRGGDVLVEFCPELKGCPFVAVVAEPDVARVGSLTALRGALVEVDGEVTFYDGVPNIFVSERAQVKKVQD